MSEVGRNSPQDQPQIRHAVAAFGASVDLEGSERAGEAGVGLFFAAGGKKHVGG